MICTHFKVIQQACTQHGLEIGQADWIRLLCTECKEHEVCPAADLSEVPEEDVKSEGAAATSNTAASNTATSNTATSNTAASITSGDGSE